MKKIIFNIAIFLALVFYSCHECKDGHTEIIFKNNTPNTIHFQLGGNIFDCKTMHFTIQSNENYTLEKPNEWGCFEDEIGEGQWFVFIDSIYCNSFDGCCDLYNGIDNGNVIARYFYTVDSLDMLNWTITIE